MEAIWYRALWFRPENTNLQVSHTMGVGARCVMIHAYNTAAAVCTHPESSHQGSIPALIFPNHTAKGSRAISNWRLRRGLLLVLIRATATKPKRGAAMVTYAPLTSRETASVARQRLVSRLSSISTRPKCLPDLLLLGCCCLAIGLGLD